jgi:hypothetical protein
MPLSVRGIIRVLVASASLLTGAARSTLGQKPGGTEASLCFGFAFGSWTPALDWQLAGHGAPIDSARVPRAPSGRGWAAIDVEQQSDSTLLLFPPWWPAGVSVKLTSKFASPQDTIPGHAVALVADGRKRPPTSAVRLWRVPCGQ